VLCRRHLREASGRCRDVAYAWCGRALSLGGRRSDWRRQSGASAQLAGLVLLRALVDSFDKVNTHFIYLVAGVSSQHG
jgi:hypothetical protein